MPTSISANGVPARFLDTPPAASRKGAFAVSTVFLLVLLLRLGSEGVDRLIDGAISLVLTVTLILLSIAMLLRNGVIVKRTLASVVILTLFVASAALSFAFNWQFETAAQLSYLVQLLLYLVVFTVASSYPWTRRDIVLLLKGIVVVMVLEALVSVFQVATGTGFTMGDFGLSRARGLSSHPVPLSIKIFALFAIMYAFRHLVSARWLTVFYGAGALALLLTFSRTGWLIVMLWIAYLAWRTRKSGLGITLLVIGIPLAVAVLFYTGRFDDLVTTTAFIEGEGYREVNHASRSNSFEWRLQHWYFLVMKGLENPFFGHGPGTTEFLNFFGLKAHNSAVDVFVEQGYLGLGLITLAFAAIYLAIRRALKIRVEVEQQRYDFVTLTNTLFVGFLSAMLVSVSLFNQLLNMVLLFLVAGWMLNLRARAVWTPNP